MGTKQALSIYVNPGDLQATTYPAGALEQTMQNFSASEHQISPLGSPFSTGTGSGSDSPDPTDEAPGWDESKRIISGGKKAKNIGPSLRKDIMKLTEKLSNKARRGGIYENFGDKEVRQLKDKYDYNSLQYGTGEERELAASIDRFSDWASIYSPHKGSSFSTQQSNTPFKDDEVRFSSRKSMEDEVLDDLVKAESKVKSHIRNVSGKIVNVREHQRYKLKGMLNFIRNYKESGVSRGSTLRKLQDRFGLSTEMAHRVHRLAEALGGALYKPFPMK